MKDASTRHVAPKEDVNDGDEANTGRKGRTTRSQTFQAGVLPLPPGIGVPRLGTGLRRVTPEQPRQGLEKVKKNKQKPQGNHRRHNDGDDEW